MVGRSVGRSRFYFSGGAGPAAAAGTESPGPRPRTPATGCRGQAVGRSARWQEDGTVPADLPARIFLQWVMTRRGPRAERYRRGPHTPRPAKSVSHVSPSRTICSYCPDDLAGPVGLRPDRGRDRPRPESCPARPLRRTHCRTIFLQGPPARRSTPRPFPSEPGPAATAPSLLLVAGPRPAVGRPVVPTSRPTISSRAANFTIQNAENFLSHIISASFRPHIFQ